MENWHEVLFPSMKAAKNSMLMKSLTSVYYISWIFGGNFILLNLFLAILIGAFEKEEEVSDLSEKQHLAIEKAADKRKL